MNMPEKLIGNLDFEEAIRIAILTEQSQHVIAQATADEVQTHHNALFKSD